jgi:hypothetical protein
MQSGLSFSLGQLWEQQQQGAALAATAPPEEQFTHHARFFGVEQKSGTNSSRSKQFQSNQQNTLMLW